MNVISTLLAAGLILGMTATARGASPQRDGQETTAPAPEASTAIPDSVISHPAADSLAAIVDTSLVFTLEARNRMYPDWREEHEVRIGEPFWLADSPSQARVQAFMSDFKMMDGKPVNYSLQLVNPAILVAVTPDSGAADSLWSFLNFPPHFDPDAFWAFQLKKVEGYEPPSSPAKSPEGQKEP